MAPPMDVALCNLPKRAKPASTALRSVAPMLPGLVLLVAVFVFPLTLILPTSFIVNGQVSGSVYASVLGDAYYWIVIGRSLWVSCLSTVVCIVFGYPVAYYLVRVASLRYRRYVYMIIIAPLFTSAVTRAMAWTIILGRRGLVNDALTWTGVIDEPLRLLYSDTAVVIGLVYIMIPFMVLTIAAVLENVDSSLEEAAQDLGATAWETFSCVTFPLTLPGVLAGGVLTFALCLSSYVTPALLGGGRNKVLAMLIFEQFMRVFNWPLGSGIACVLLVITLLLIWGYSRVLARRAISSRGRTGVEAVL
jgi:putative spermidine/putrescine transport system permease protein